MSATAAYAGYVKIGANTIQLLNSADLQAAAKQLDVTALGGPGWDAFIMGTLGGKVACKGAYDMTDSTGQALVRAAFFGRTQLSSVVFSPDGIKTYTFNCWVLDYHPAAAVAAVAAFDFTLLPTGAITQA